MFDIITAMGRMRIKKKTAAKPFRQTMPYRLLLVLFAILLFVFTFYELVTSWVAQNTVAFVISAVAAVLAAILFFYNFDKARKMPMPERKRYR